MMSAAAIDPRFDVDLPTPVLVVDIDVFEANVRALADRAHQAGMRYLPHAKTHRILDLGLRQIACGADGLCVATLTEAEAFAAAGVERIFIAFPVVDRFAADRLLELSRRCELTVGVDSVAGAALLADHFTSARPLAVLLGVDSGNAREGVAPADALGVAQAIAALEGIEVRGVYTHEGSTYRAPDAAGLADASAATAQVLLGVAEQLRANGIACPVVSMGASASAFEMTKIAGVTEIRPGINAFNDTGQIALGLADLQSTAVRVLATVASLPEPDRGCLNAGGKSLGKDLVPASAHLDEYPGYGLLVNAPGWQLSALSEEHGWLRPTVDDPAPIAVGDRIEIVPNHVCVAFSALRRVHYVSGGVVVEAHDVIPPS